MSFSVSSVELLDDSGLNDFSIEIRSTTTNESSCIEENIKFDLNIFSSTPNSNHAKFANNLQQENEITMNKILPFLRQFRKQELSFIKLHQEGINDMEDLLYLKDSNEKAFETCSQILNYYNIMLCKSSETRKCSALKVLPLTPSLQLYDCLKYLLDVLLIFPFSFYYKLGINSITLCEEITLLKSEHKEIYKKRLLSGLMPIKQVNTKDGTTRYILLLIIYYMHLKLPNMHTEWIYSFWPSYKKKLTKLSSILLEDQYQTLKFLVTGKFYHKVDKTKEKFFKEKAKKMRDYLIVIDADAFGSEYWKTLRSLI